MQSAWHDLSLRPSLGECWLVGRKACSVPAFDPNRDAEFVSQEVLYSLRVRDRYFSEKDARSIADEMTRKSWPRLPSEAPFWRLMVDQCECPPIRSEVL